MDTCGCFVMITFRHSIVDHHLGFGSDSYYPDGHPEALFVLLEPPAYSENYIHISRLYMPLNGK